MSWLIIVFVVIPVIIIILWLASEAPPQPRLPED